MNPERSGEEEEEALFPLRSSEELAATKRPRSRVRKGGEAIAAAIPEAASPDESEEELEGEEVRSESLNTEKAESEFSSVSQEKASGSERSGFVSQLGFIADDEQTSEEQASENEFLIKQLEAITKRFQEDSTEDGSETHRSDELIEALTDTLTESSASPYASFMRRSSLLRSISYPGNFSGMEDHDSGIEGEGDAEEGRLSILDPNHPLMQRFQAAYKEHLEKHKEKISLEIQEAQQELKELTRTREDKGELLYNVQQELAKLQNQLEQMHNEQHSIAEQRMTFQEHLLVSREKHKNLNNVTNELNRRALELRAELSRWDLVLHFMNQFNEEMKTDVGVIRCAAEKAETNFQQLQLQKKKQDVIIKKKMEEVNTLEEMLGLYVNHCISQEDELTGARLTLAESQMQMECVEMEKKQIFQQWKNALHQLEQKDDLIRTFNEALREMLNDILTREANITLLKKDIDKEMELSEILTMTRERTEKICSNVVKEKEALRKKMENVERQYSEKLRVLKETEDVIQSTTKQNIFKKEEENKAQMKLESLIKSHNTLEDKLMDVMMEQMMQQKAETYCSKMTQKMKEKSRHLLATLVKIENEYSSLILKTTNSNVRCEKLSEILKTCSREVEESTSTVKGIENLIARNNLTISKKQVVINNRSGRLEELMKTVGGDEISPLEAHIRYLEKSIDEKIVELQNQKANWLRRQTELVHATQSIDQSNDDCIQMNRRFYIMQNKKQRVNAKIEEEEKAIHHTEVNIKKHQTVILKNNERLGYEKGIQETLSADTVLMENNVIYTLKDAELENIQLQDKIENVLNEKKRLENKLIEAQQQVMFWEKKIQLAKEAKALVSSDEVSGEIQAMRWEIHRMQVRHNQLRRQQEILIQESEKLIGKRDNIISRNEAQNKMVKKLMTKTSAQKTIEELKKKTKQALQESHILEEEIARLSTELSSSGKEVEELSESVGNMKSQSENLEKSIRLTERKFQKNFHHLVALQTACKYLQAVREGKYKKLCKQGQDVESELEASLNKARLLQEIILNYADDAEDVYNEVSDLAARHKGRLDAISCT